MNNRSRLLGLVVLLALTTFLAATLIRQRSGAGAQVAAVRLLPAVSAAPAEATTYIDTLRAGETLSELMTRADLEQDDAQAILAELAAHQDPRRMPAGSVFAFQRSTADGALRRMQIRLDADRTLDVSPNLAVGGWTGSIAEVPVQMDTVVMTGVVTTSLYEALLSGEGGVVPPIERELVVDMLADRIFAWEVDFSRDLRSGDRFRILYERQVRPNGTAREGRVLGVQFSIDDRPREAYLFTNGEGAEDYFNREGESLRRAFLRAPLQYRRISSAFSRSRFHPILRVSRPHNGIDYAASSGTPVHAVGDGVIQRANRSSDFGNVVEIRHIRGYGSRYAHLRGFAAGIRRGVRVEQGDVIGYVGQTGLATAPHLHYEFHRDGRAVNPNSAPNIAGEPVPSADRDAFLNTVRAHVASLDRVSSAVLLAGDENPPAAELGG